MNTRIQPARTLLFFLSVCFAFVGCSDDDPVKPPETRTIQVSDVASLRQAVRQALPEDRIVAAPGTYAMDSTLVVTLLANDVELLGRTDPTAERAVLQFSGRTIGVLVTDDTEFFTLRGFTLRGFTGTGVVLRGLGGRVEDCRIEGGVNYSVSIPVVRDSIAIENNILIGAGQFGVNCGLGSSPRVIGNTIVDVRDCGIFVAFASPYCERNLVYRTRNYGVYASGDPGPTLVCNDITASGAGNYGGTLDTGGETDIDADPLFCDEESYALREDSPCAAANSTCGQIGAVGVTCDR